MDTVKPLLMKKGFWGSLVIAILGVFAGAGVTVEPWVIQVVAGATGAALSHGQVKIQKQVD